MSYRIVLYGEGPGDLGHNGDDDPRFELTDDDLGPAHVLVRRVVVARRGLPEAAVRFRWRYRDRRGRPIRGSMLLDVQTRRELAALHRYADERIDLVVLLVDRDGDPHRTEAWLAEPFTTIALPVAAGVAQEEFEAWLIGDGAAVASRTGSAPPAFPETLPPSHAKAWLAQRLSGQGARDARCDLARMADLAALGRSCPSFASLADQLRPESGT